MASHSEGVVLKLVIDELEQMPVRGAERRAKIQRMIDVLDEMSQYRSYESGRYRHLGDAMDMVKFYRGKRAQLGVRGRPVSPVIDLEPGYTMPAKYDEREKITSGSHRGLTQEQVENHESQRKKLKPAKILSQEEVDELQFKREHPND